MMRAALTADIIAFAEYGRYGYRRIAALLRDDAGWVVNVKKRIERIWRLERLRRFPQSSRGRPRSQ